MRKTYIFCDGGLGNRLGTLIGGLITSKLLNTNPVISWPENSWCGCSFDDLYDSKYEFINHDINKLFSDNINNIFLIHENQTRLNIKNIYNHSLKSLSHIKNEISDVVYYHNSIPSYFRYDEIIKTLNDIKINENLLITIKDFIEKNKIDKSVNGIHFRKTDAPNDENETIYYEEIVNSPTKKYFICSDDENTEKLFKGLDNVIMYPKTQYVEKYKNGGWNDRIVDYEGRHFNFNVNRPRMSVIEAFIDMILLSRTNIITNSHSSFLNFSKIYSNIEL